MFETTRWPVAFVMLLCAQLVLEVSAQSTVDYDGVKCESSALNQAVDLIRKDVIHLKYICASNQKQDRSTQQSSNLSHVLAAALMCEYNYSNYKCMFRIRKYYKLHETEGKSK